MLKKVFIPTKGGIYRVTAEDQDYCRRIVELEAECCEWAGDDGWGPGVAQTQMGSTGTNQEGLSKPGPQLKGVSGAKGILAIGRQGIM